MWCLAEAAPFWTDRKDNQLISELGTALQATKQVTVSEQKLKVAINGFGRIGRNFLRCWNGRSSSLLDVVAINDSGGVKQVGTPSRHRSLALH